jgi:hypothetical protein
LRDGRFTSCASQAESVVMRIATILASVVAVLALAAPVASADPGQVTHDCVSFDAHVPGGGNELQGEQIVVNGGNDQKVHDHFVVGPCKTAA